jgi:hypothetical protein
VFNQTTVYLAIVMGTVVLGQMFPKNTYFLAHKMQRPTRRFVIFSLEILEERKSKDECILILVIYWKKTGLLHTKISNHNVICSS